MEMAIGIAFMGLLLILSFLYNINVIVQKEKGLKGIIRSLELDLLELRKEVRENRKYSVYERYKTVEIQCFGVQKADHSYYEAIPMQEVIDKLLNNMGIEFEEIPEKQKEYVLRSKHVPKQN